MLISVEIKMYLLLTRVSAEGSLYVVLRCWSRLACIHGLLIIVSVDVSLYVLLTMVLVDGVLYVLLTMVRSRGACTCCTP